MWCTDGATLGRSRKRKVCVGALLLVGRLHRMERALHGKRAFHGKRLNYR